ncbi:MAG TPA: hypothetical protein VFJ15_05595 [Oleiagrimonas sp.]|nr:hypothetical protein [Oleiagrimonas sp.]
MNLVLLGCVVAWLAALAGLTLAVGHVARWRFPRWLMWAHPTAATVALACLWVAVVRRAGPTDLVLNSGVFVLTLAWVAGVFLFALRRSGLRRMPAIVIGPHALVALAGCGLLVAGLVHA